MKMHSYITVNGQLQGIDNEAKSLFSQLQSVTESVGGWDKAIEDASALRTDHLAREAAAAANSRADLEPTPIGTPSVPEGLSTSYLDAKTANALRKRLVEISHARSSDASLMMPTTSSGESYLEPPGPYEPRSGDKRVVGEGEDDDDGFQSHVLVYHPDEKISALASEYTDLQSELISSGPNHVKWQDAITWKNFAVYQLIPTLVYELEYPRTDRLVLVLRRWCAVADGLQVFGPSTYSRKR